MSEDAIDPQKALRAIALMAPQYAQAKANRIYMEEFRKTLKARFMRDAERAGQRTAAMQERDAYACDGYADHLKAIEAAVQAEEALRWKLIAAEAAVEVWRSQEASNRRIDKAAA